MPYSCSVKQKVSPAWTLILLAAHWTMLFKSPKYQRLKVWFYNICRYFYKILLPFGIIGEIETICWRGNFSCLLIKPTNL